MTIQNFIDYLRGTRKNTASVAKERLQIIVSHQRSQRQHADFLPLLQQEILEVIAKYVEIDRDLVKVELARTDNCAVLELNVTLPDQNRE